jgi:hypothetical protein
VVGAAAGAEVAAAAAAGAYVAGGAAAGVELVLEQAARSGKLAAIAAAPKVCLRKERRDESSGCMSPGIVGPTHRGVKKLDKLHRWHDCPYIMRLE